MRAVLYGSKGAMVMTNGVAVPPGPSKSLDPGQLLVRVHACALNPVDYKLGSLPVVSWMLRGKAVAQDFAGTVERVGTSASNSFAVGDRVFGRARGSLAEFAVADASAVAKLPARVSMTDGASLTTVGLTSLQALREGNGCASGASVLVIGASGGCGSMGVQIAKLCGAKVTAVCSGQNADSVRALGADVVADYTQGDTAMLSVLQTQAPFDCIYDCVTSPEDKDYTPLARQLLKPDGGKLIAINGGGGAWTRTLLGRMMGMNLHPRWYKLILCRSDAGQLQELAQWVASGTVKPQVETIFPFTQEGVDEAYKCLKSRRTRGKLVVTVAQ